MTENALDGFVELIQMNTNPNELLRLSIPQGQLDSSVRYMAGLLPDIYHEALQDPRYLQYCKEQDRKGAEEGVCLKCGGAGWLWAGELDTFEGNPSFDDTKYTCDGC